MKCAICAANIHIPFLGFQFYNEVLCCLCYGWAYDILFKKYLNHE